MSAYFINELRMRDGIANEEGLAHVRRTVEVYGGRWHSDRAAQAAKRKSQILVEFGTMSQAESWYSSSEYENVTQLYVDNAIALVLVDEVSPDFTMAGFAQERPASPTSEHGGVPKPEPRQAIADTVWFCTGRPS
jgi:uncharacterized protein (DUF1330 family)